MKSLRRITSLLLVLLLIASILPAGGLAATISKVVTLKTGSWSAVQKYAGKMPAYKLTLSQDTVIKTEWKGATRKSLYVWIHTKKDCSDSHFTLNDSSAVSGTREVALSKGTYYIQIYDYYNKSQIKFSLKPVTSTGIKNYCAYYATALKAGKKATIAQSPQYNHARWFKIKLGKKKKLTIKTDSDNGYNIKLYDSKVTQISTTVSGGDVTSKEALKKGTYYIRVNEGPTYSTSPFRGDVKHIRWN